MKWINVKYLVTLKSFKRSMTVHKSADSAAVSSSSFSLVSQLYDARACNLAKVPRTRSDLSGACAVKSKQTWRGL